MFNEYDSESGDSEMPPLSPLRPYTHASNSSQSRNATPSVIHSSKVPRTPFVHNPNRVLFSDNDMTDRISEESQSRSQHPQQSTSSGAPAPPRSISNVSLASVSNLDFMMFSSSTLETVNDVELHEHDSTPTRGSQCYILEMPVLRPSPSDTGCVKHEPSMMTHSEDQSEEAQVGVYDQSQSHLDHIVLVDESDDDSVSTASSVSDLHSYDTTLRSTSSLAIDAAAASGKLEVLTSDAADNDSNTNTASCEVLTMIDQPTISTMARSPQPTSSVRNVNTHPVRPKDISNRLRMRTPTEPMRHPEVEIPSVPITWRYPKESSRPEHPPESKQHKLPHMDTSSRCDRHYINAQEVGKSSLNVSHLDDLLEDQLHSTYDRELPQVSLDQGLAPTNDGVFKPTVSNPHCHAPDNYELAMSSSPQSRLAPQSTARMPATTLAMLSDERFSAAVTKLIQKLYSPETFLPIGTRLPTPPAETLKQYLACQMSVVANGDNQATCDAGGSSWHNMNSHLTDQLEELERMYKALGDVWRAFTFRRVASVFKQLKYKVETEAQVREIARTVRGVGDKTANKLVEILTNQQPPAGASADADTAGTQSESYVLRRLQVLRSRQDVRALDALTKVHGVGAKLALKWYRELGAQTIDDIRYLSGELDAFEDEDEDLANSQEPFSSTPQDQGVAQDSSCSDGLDSASTLCGVTRRTSSGYNSSGGLRSISATVLLSVDKGSVGTKLSATQKVGLNFTHDMQKRIPRAEVTAIAAYIKRTLARIAPAAIVVCCGSYRRGAETSGDVDILISHPSWISAESSARARLNLCTSLLAALQLFNVEHEFNEGSKDVSPAPVSAAESTLISQLAEGLQSHAKPEDMVLPAGARAFLTGTLATSTFKRGELRKLDSTSGNSHLQPTTSSIRRVLKIESDGSLGERGYQCSWSGFCKLPSWNPHVSGLNRRLDIKFFAFPHLPYATLYFTGSDHFNRSMRYYAQQLGWSLADTGLRPAVRASRVRLSLGKSIFALSEEDIFEAMGLVYVPPHLRNTYHSIAPLQTE